VGSILFNPMEHAYVSSRGRVDEGVDFGMSGGYLSAIANCQVIYSTYSPSGWPGAYIAYRIIDAPGLVGAHIYYAEGVTSLVPQGTTLQGGEGVCKIVPGGSIEIGLAGTNLPNSWAKDHGDIYDQVNSTRAGVWFNELLGILHAPQGYVQGTPTGPWPGYNLHGISAPGSTVLSPGQLLTLYNPSSIIRHSFYRFGRYGRLASYHGHLIRLLAENTRYTTTKGIN
jgi:hypothetical protein